MNLKLTSIITALILEFLLVLHWVEDVALKFEGGGPTSVYVVIVLAVVFYPMLAYAGRRAGYVALLIGSLGGVGILVIHTMGVGMTGGRMASSPGVLVWVWHMVALGTTGAFGIILSLDGLWSLRKG